MRYEGDKEEGRGWHLISFGNVQTITKLGEAKGTSAVNRESAGGKALNSDKAGSGHNIRRERGLQFC